MASLQLMPEAIQDFDRILDYLVRHQVPNPSTKVMEIRREINLLEHTPLLGHPILNDKRELFIGSRHQGYVALYKYLPDIDTVFVLNVRSQRQKRKR